ncbi:hypothetical protein MANES_07G143800v8 [Manihot esculenta]|uniref:Uncharacterized protein n=1 Tax=Manihot esculenta TaxID=3983 RepID=A0A2C9VLE3_MANES|nr:hypothetical protein MANES_07G143800v8 [Manihot esculenta]
MTKSKGSHSLAQQDQGKMTRTRRYINPCMPCYLVSKRVSRCLFVCCFPVLQCLGLDDHRHHHHHLSHFR